MIWTLPPIFTLCPLRGATPVTPLFQGLLSSGNSSCSLPMTPEGLQLGAVMESIMDKSVSAHLNSALTEMAVIRNETSEIKAMLQQIIASNNKSGQS